MCPSYLDGDQPDTERIRLVIPVRPGGLSQMPGLWLLYGFQGSPRGLLPVRLSTPAAGLSKLNSMHGCQSALCGLRRARFGRHSRLPGRWPSGFRARELVHRYGAVPCRST